MFTTVESDISSPATSSKATTSHTPSSPTRPVPMCTNNCGTVTLPPEMRMAFGDDSRYTTAPTGATRHRTTRNGRRHRLTSGPRRNPAAQTDADSHHCGAAIRRRLQPVIEMPFDPRLRPGDVKDVN